MKIGRSPDHLAVTATTEELAEICRAAGLRHYSQLSCWGRYVGRRDEVEIYFGSGRAFRSNEGGTLWTLSLDPDAAQAQSLEYFGMSPTMWEIGTGRKLIVRVPEFKSPLRRSKPVIEKTAAFIPRARGPIALPPTRAPQRVISEPTHKQVNESDLLTAKNIFNTAIERGFQPQFDARGRILYFDRRVGE